MKKNLLRTGCLTFLFATFGLTSARVHGQSNSLPGSFALPAGAVDTTKKGFLVRTWLSPGQPGTLAWTEEQLAGLHGDNTADTSTFTDKVFGNSYLDESGVINYWNTGGEGDFKNNGTQNVPGLPNDASNVDSYSLEVFALLDLPAGTLTMGVNSDDGFRVTALHTPDVRDKLALDAGEYNAGRGAADSLFTLVVEKAGVYPFRLIYFEGGGDSELEWFTMGPDGNRHLINDATDSASIKAYRAATGNARAYATSALPRPGDTAASPNVAIDVELVDGADPIDTATVKLSLDGAAVAATVAKTGNATSVKFSSPTLSPAGSTHAVTLAYSEGANPVTTTWSYTVGQYIALPPTAKVTADTSKPGFIWNIFANGTTAAEVSNQRVDSALAGLLKDADGNPLPNLADPAAQGVASAPSTAPSPANAPISFEIPTVINVSQVDGTILGNFTPDSQMPGVPATDSSSDGMSVEIITYIDLPAGATTMGVNSDDGFRTTAGNPLDVFQATVLGAFDGGRGSADTTFNIVVQEAGVYAFRTIYEEGGGDAGIEWFTLKSDGVTKVLVNDTANGGLKSYRAVTGGYDPYFKSVTPPPLARQVNQPSSSVSIVLADGSSKTIDDTSIVLQVDGKTVTPTKNRQGKTVTLTHTPDGLQTPTEQHTASLTFNDSTGAARTQAWTFYNLKNLVLPTAKITDNFDSYPEDTQPTGWVATNFTAHCDDGRDPDSQKSVSFENWVLVSVEHAPDIDGGVLNVAPGQILNGQPVTSISSGNILYAESDSRCNTDSAGGLNVGQTQFIVSKAFDCSQIANVVLSFSALYTQNQDSYGGVEYSVDGGTTWLPIVYYLDPPDIVLKSDGTVDAVATFTAPNTDTSYWYVNGVLKGAGAHGYGDAVGAAITQDLAIYIAPRLNDNQFEGARIEAYRLPKAGAQKDVRLRFSAMGTDSWWFAVDNIAFYDVAASVTPPPPTGGQPTDLGQTVSGFQDDFTGTTRNPGWVARGAGGDVYHVNNGVLSVQVRHLDPNHLLYEVPGYHTNIQEVLARIRVVQFGKNSDGPRGGIGTAVATNTSQGINMEFRDDLTDSNEAAGQKARKVKLLDDALSWGPTGVKLEWVENTWYWFRLRHDPNAGGSTNDAFGKVWLADGVTPEPTDWQTKWNYTPKNELGGGALGVRSGYAGITGSSSDGVGNFEVDYILIKADGLPSIKVDFAPQGPPPTVPAFSDIQISGKNIVFSWEGIATLQQADAVDGPWTNVASAASPRTVAIGTTTQKFYRLQ